MDKKELQKLEDEHNRKLRDLERLEMDLDDDFHKFSRETDHLLEALSYACRDSSFAEIQPYIFEICLLYTSPSPRDATLSRMPSSA